MLVAISLAPVVHGGAGMKFFPRPSSFSAPGGSKFFCISRWKARFLTWCWKYWAVGVSPKRRTAAWMGERSGSLSIIWSKCSLNFFWAFPLLTSSSFCFLFSSHADSAASAVASAVACLFASAFLLLHAFLRFRFGCLTWEAGVKSSSSSLPLLSLLLLYSHCDLFFSLPSSFCSIAFWGRWLLSATF